MFRNKLGLHHATGGRDTKRWMLESRPTVMKFVADLGASNEAPPGILCVGRVVDDGLLDHQGFDMNRMWREGRSPASTAQWYIEAVLFDKIMLNPRIDVWSGPNEQVFEWDADGEKKDAALAKRNQEQRESVMRWYARFLYEFAREIQRFGKRALIGGWAVGNPIKEHNLWPQYIWALKACREWGAILERHEYGQLNGSHSLRYRWDNAEFAKLGYPNMPVIISECGGDNVPGSGPWKLFYKTIDRYWDELLHPYALALLEDSYVLGATVFTCGGGWVDFEVSGSGLVDKVIAFANSLPDAPIEIPEDDMDLVKIKADLKIASDATARATVDTQIANAALARVSAEINVAPVPWWQTWPTGAIVPSRKLKIPNKSIEFFHSDGTPFVPAKKTIVSWTMDVSERVGNLLRVFDQDGIVNDWYVKAEDVEPL